MKKILYALLLVLAASLAMAQETSTPNQQKKPADNTATKQSEPAKPAAKNTTNTTKTPDTFVPSEQISEDLSVSFPVDI